MTVTIRSLSRLLAVPLAAVLFGWGTIGCDSKPATPPVSWEGAGDEVSADPVYEITLDIRGQTVKLEPDMFCVYEPKPPTEGRPASVQTFDLLAGRSTLVGRLPEGLNLAPGYRFTELSGKPLEVRPLGGDPNGPSSSRLMTPDGKLYDVLGGELTVNRASHRKDPRRYFVSGHMKLKLQEMKPAPEDQPDAKDEKVGEPFEATGTFTSRANSMKYLSM